MSHRHSERKGDKLRDFSLGISETIQRFGGSVMLPDVCVDPDRLPWITYPGSTSVFLRPLWIDLRNNRAVSVTRFDGPQTLGSHRHEGEVLSFTIAGRWRYLEYDWEASPGKFVYEGPGRVHTLSVLSDDGATVLFVQTGGAQSMSADGMPGFSEDAFFLCNLYLAHCVEHGLDVEERIIV